MTEKKELRETLVMEVKNTAMDFRRDRYILLEIYGRNIGLRRDIEKDEILIGRSLDCDIVLEDQGVSRRHLQITKYPLKVEISDQGSTNGTYINDVRMFAPTTLNNGDRIKIGNTIFKFIWSDDLEADYYDTLYQYTIRDGLTGLFNKKYLLEMLDKEFLRAQKSRQSFSVMMIDIDFFKKVNDSYGHIAGDRVLIKVAEMVKNYIQETDCAARFGGEEFSILLPETKLEGASFIAERVRLAVQGLVFTEGSKEITVSVSIGVAEIAASMKSGLELLNKADEKLYVAKNSGRNKVEN